MAKYYEYYGSKFHETINAEKFVSDKCPDMEFFIDVDVDERNRTHTAIVDVRSGARIVSTFESKDATIKVFHEMLDEKGIVWLQAALNECIAMWGISPLIEERIQNTEESINRI